MIGSCEHDDIARQLIELHQEKRNDALDFAGLMGVAAFFADGVEIVEKKHARGCSNIIEQPYLNAHWSRPDSSRSERHIEPHKKEAPGFSDRLREGCLAVAGRA